MPQQSQYRQGQYRQDPPRSTPSIGTCFALAVVLAAVAALTIPRAGADVVNDLVERLTADRDELNGEPSHDQQPNLRQPNGWGQGNAAQGDASQNSTSQNNTRQNNPGTDAGNAQSQNAQPASSTATNTQQDPATAQGAAQSQAGQHSTPQDNAAQRNDAQQNSAQNNAINAAGGNAPRFSEQQPSAGSNVGTDSQAPWRENIPPSATSSEDQAPQQLPEVLTRDWSDAPNRTLSSRSGSGDLSAGDAPKNSLVGALTPAASGLAIVIGLFLLCTWLLRKKLPRLVGALPTDVFEVLGKTSLDKKHKLHLVRCGGKLALLSVSASGVETLLEIDEQDDVTRISGMCKELQSGSSTAEFRDVLSELNAESSRGFAGRGRARGASA